MSPPSRSLVFLLALGAGLSVAALYYNQPILVTIARDLRATPAAIGVVPMMTQLGYASGIVLSAPLGDRLDRRRVIVVKLLALAAALVAAGAAPTVPVLAAASLAIGALATAAQDFVPAAAAVAPPSTRGRIVGTVMTGLFLGILLSRLASGAAGDRFGWRAVFFGAAAIAACLAAVCARVLPSFPPSTTASYGALLRSLVSLTRDLPSLRRATLVQSLISLAFSAFWSTLALALAAPPYRLGSTVAGAFGLAGAAGAVIAPLAGAAADRRGPVSITRIGTSVVVAAFLLMTAVQGSLVVLVAGAVLFDLGAQASLIAHQTIVYGLAPEARSRVNAVLVSSMFVGMAVGAAAGSNAFARFGWSGVTTLGTVAAAAALALRSLPERSAETPRPLR